MYLIAALSTTLWRPHFQYDFKMKSKFTLEREKNCIQNKSTTSVTENRIREVKTREIKFIFITGVIKFKSHDCSTQAKLSHTAYTNISTSANCGLSHTTWNRNISKFIKFNELQFLYVRMLA